MSIIRVTRKFLSILSKKAQKRILFLIILMIGGGFLEMCSVSLVVPFMNGVMNPDEIMGKWYAKYICQLLGVESSNTFLVIVAAVLASVYIIKNIYLVFEYNVQYHFVYDNMFEMQRRLLDNYIHRPYEYFLKVDSGEIIRIVNSDTPSVFASLSTVLSLYSELVVSGILVCTVFVITPLPTLCMAVLLLFMLLVVSKIIKPALGRAGEQNQQSAAGMNKWLLQSIQGIKELKVMGKEDFFQQNFDRYGYKYVNAVRKGNVLSMMPRFFIEAVSMSTMFILIALMIYSGSNIQTIIPILTAVAVAAIRLLPSVNRMSNSIANVAYNEPMLDKLIENVNRGESISKTGQDKTETDCSKGLNHDFPQISSNITFDKVCFRYPETEIDILSDASMKICKGESIGIVGSSGAGKTTAIDILLGLLHPQDGKVTVDGVNIDNNLRGWHEQVAYIPQSIFLLNDTIKNNICFGLSGKDIQEERLKEAMEKASLSSFVESLPKGVDTEIGERGVRLSGGQRQRIGIARALYRNPNVLVFDEATSALDNETETAIMESIYHLQGKVTMVIIAHRLSTIEGCDHIFRVEDKKIIKER